MKEATAERLADLCRNILSSGNWLVIQECHTQLVYFATYASHVEMVEKMIPESAQPALINFVGKIPVPLEGCTLAKAVVSSKPQVEPMVIDKIVELVKNHQSRVVERISNSTTRSNEGNASLLAQVQKLNLLLEQSGPALGKLKNYLIELLR
ncbi:hypothetical protein K493DRAFT_310840 [Basidiobolus meristosporus CBS 931.73]|uniref:Uncharacterized protein n=1 Tax=Basidiobolus meristosporus CBS 931.73 TaxID=1314790 RepID=A0A1Y1Z623_9FUNG|nr:hypothetical protein K493DRAFT_310840 [Basidiobolus meristosporus CBS 931.73]|eukprot:ORY05752.1 hypothetical protein K493DRAFT_310840 [Basidiobolus meristosporus CBS 931.73]